MAAATEGKQSKKVSLAFRCAKCKTPLVYVWFALENDPDDPNDNTVQCFRCTLGKPEVAGAIQQTMETLGLVKPPPPPPSLAPMFWALIFGLAAGFIVAWIKWGPK